MSILDRLLGKSPPGETPAPLPPAAPADTAPALEAAARVRDEEARVAEAIEAGDEIALGRWVLEGSSTRIRQQAAHGIADPDLLRELIRATRHGKDKTVHRILTDKRDGQLAEARRLEQQQAEVQAAASAVARHAERPCDTAYPAMLAQVETRWRTVEPHATAELRREVEQQLARGRDTIERHRQAVEAEAERQRAADLAAEEARRQREAQAQAEAAAAAERARQLDAERQAERQAERDRRAAEDAAVHELVGLLRQAQAALDHGGTARAARLRESIAAKLPQAPPLPEWYARNLQKVDERLAELKDWKTFRVLPKQGELVERMQSLVGADISPEELARQIRRLRDEWRTLHRGAGDEPTPEWQQFDAAAERAYEPCRAHFAQQAEQRRQNQAQREALLERLATFTAAQADGPPNWRAIQQVLVEARREWQQYAPVDQSVVKSLQARFHALLDELKAPLDAEYARNVQAKRDIVARAAELVTLPDTRQAIDEAKRLQHDWRAVGIVPRHQDNALWEAFRRHCDAVFARSAQESAAHGAALESNQARATALCEEFERIAGLVDAALLEAVPTLDPLRQEFESLDLPRASARELRQRFQRANDRCGQALRRHRETEERRGWSDLFAAAARVRAYALAAVQGTPPEDCEALRTSAAAAVESLAHAPKGTRAILEQQLGAIAAGTVGGDAAANEAALRLLCIRAELATDAETPPEDLDRRREYQMQRLVEALGRGERATPADLDTLAREWLAVGPIEATVYEALYARFERCLQR